MCESTWLCVAGVMSERAMMFLDQHGAYAGSVDQHTYVHNPLCGSAHIRPQSTASKEEKEGGRWKSSQSQGATESKRERGGQAEAGSALQSGLPQTQISGTSRAPPQAKPSACPIPRNAPNAPCCRRCIRFRQHCIISGRNYQPIQYMPRVSAPLAPHRPSPSIPLLPSSSARPPRAA